MAHHTEIVPIDQLSLREATKDEFDGEVQIVVPTTISPTKRGVDVESCISALEKKKDEALKCYDDNLDNDIVDNFLEMLLLDGCFVVEFIREYYATEEKEEEDQEEEEDNDNIINLEWMKKQVCRDMVLLENQLPFFVLTMLHDMTKHHKEVSFLYMVRKTLLDTFPKAKFIPPSEIHNFNTERFNHLVHVIHMFCRPSDHHDGMKDKQNKNASTPKECCKITFCDNVLQLTKSKETPKVLGLWDCYHIPSVTELYDAGVRFIRVGYVQEKKEDKTTLFDIKFEKGLMKIPCFAIEDTMETFMRNLIAYEQHSSKVDVYPYFSNYAHIMTQLIGSHRDVKFLRKEKIILKDIGDDKQVASIFKKLSDGVEITSFYYIKECSKLIQHCDKPWSQMKASLRHNYFSSPWVGASTVAAITLLVLTVIQTVLAFTGDVMK
uniref:Uncharacterized protein n=2 Tax=Solanum tuberosum TaxID=4113 RepID=M1CDC7_SOLTU